MKHKWKQNKKDCAWKKFLAWGIVKWRSLWIKKDKKRVFSPCVGRPRALLYSFILYLTKVLHKKLHCETIKDVFQINQISLHMSLIFISHLIIYKNVCKPFSRDFLIFCSINKITVNFAFLQYTKTVPFLSKAKW